MQDSAIESEMEGRMIDKKERLVEEAAKAKSTATAKSIAKAKSTANAKSTGKVYRKCKERES